MHCSTCKYWSPRAEGPGTCRRHAPKPTIIPAPATQGGLAMVWPNTAESEWCGEHEAKEAAAPREG
jgi:hypothetical protein